MSDPEGHGHKAVLYKSHFPATKAFTKTFLLERHHCIHRLINHVYTKEAQSHSYHCPTTDIIVEKIWKVKDGLGCFLRFTDRLLLYETKLNFPETRTNCPIFFYQLIIVWKNIPFPLCRHMEWTLKLMKLSTSFTLISFQHTSIMPQNLV